MRILVISDSHRREDNIRKVFQKETFDAVIHLGDSENHTYEIENLLKDKNPSIPIVFIVGNCDDSFEAGPKVVKYDGISFYLTHGHREHVYDGYDLLSYKAKENGCSYALFGHTHIPDLFEKNGVTIANPGSISSPHQYPPVPTYLMIDIDAEKNVNFTHHEM